MSDRIWAARGSALKLASIVALMALAGCHTTPETTPAPPKETALAVVPPVTEPLSLGRGGVGDRIFFDYDSSTLTPEARAIVERQVAFAKQHPELTFTIEGHCDERGTRAYNMALAARRAEAARRAWVALGIDPGRLRTISYGKERPAVPGETETAWAQNRRAVTILPNTPPGS